MSKRHTRPHKPRRNKNKKRNRYIKHLRRARKNERMIDDHQLYKEWLPVHK